jgi:hypothetical protein
MPEADVTWQILDKEGLNSRWPTKDNCFGSVQPTRKTRSLQRTIDAPLMLKSVSVDSRAGGGTCSKNSTVNDPSSMKQMIAIRQVPVMSGFRKLRASPETSPFSRGSHPELAQVMVKMFVH